jgi:hypothetical protein
MIVSTCAATAACHCRKSDTSCQKATWAASPAVAERRSVALRRFPAQLLRRIMHRTPDNDRAHSEIIIVVVDIDHGNSPFLVRRNSSIDTVWRSTQQTSQHAIVCDFGRARLRRPGSMALRATGPVVPAMR